ncbi:MAG: hypothetical protein IT304_01885 [Dehalococcoidia bacterium]|nr:hypothetical protein [Dehalococcoidia bacterium]
MSAEVPADRLLADDLTVGEVVARWPGALAVLEGLGIHLDPFTLIAVRATPEQLAEYSALRDPGELRRALAAFAAAASGGNRLSA